MSRNNLINAFKSDGKNDSYLSEETRNFIAEMQKTTEKWQNLLDNIEDPPLDLNIFFEKDKIELSQNLIKSNLLKDIFNIIKDHCIKVIEFKNSEEFKILYIDNNLEPVYNGQQLLLGSIIVEFLKDKDNILHHFLKSILVSFYCLSHIFIKMNKLDAKKYVEIIIIFSEELSIEFDENNECFFKILKNSMKNGIEYLKINIEKIKDNMDCISSLSYILEFILIIAKDFLLEIDKNSFEINDMIKVLIITITITIANVLEYIHKSYFIYINNHYDNYIPTYLKNSSQIDMIIEIIELISKSLKKTCDKISCNMYIKNIINIISENINSNTEIIRNLGDDFLDGDIEFNDDIIIFIIIKYLNATINDIFINLLLSP